MTALAVRVTRARRPGECPDCAKPINVGDQIALCGYWRCITCQLRHQRNHRQENDPVTNALQATTLGDHVLAVPGRHEAEALTDCCPRCSAYTQPAAVADEVHGTRTTGRYGTYRCASCGYAWLCWWSRAGMLANAGKT